MYKRDNTIGQVEDDITLWRYHDLPRYMDLLIREQLFFNNIEQFEDPFEGGRSANDYSSDKNAVISTWHMNREENYAMWSIYARGIYGLAIQTTTRRLKCCFKKGTPDVLIRKVKYVSDPTLASSKGVKSYFMKRNIYKYESELRCCVLPKSNTIWEAQGAYNGIFVNVDLKMLIQRVYISPYSPVWFRDLVARINRKFRITAELSHSNIFNLTERVT